MESRKITYYNEISLMMFGFGDSHKPNPDTVRLVENIVLDQMKRIVREALKYSEEPNTLTGKELVFLMRKNKWRMRRFVKYLKNKMLKSNVESMMSSSVRDVDKTVSKHELLLFIESIDETGELTDLTEFDQVKYERQLRQDRISIALDEAKYIEFYKARCASFKSHKCSDKHNEKLSQWICPEKDVKFKKHTLEVLSYYAYETVAQITDYALLVRMDTKSTNDPIKCVSGAHFTAAMFHGDHRFGGSKPDYSRVYTGQPPISVNEIKEVMRRVTCPQSGKLNFGRKLPDSHTILVI